MVKANVDKILEILSQKKSSSVGELSKLLNLKPADVQKSAEYLEQDGVVKIEHKFPYVMVTLIKDLNQEAKKEDLPLPPPTTSANNAQPQTPKENIALNDNSHFDLNFKPQEPQQRPSDQQPVTQEQRPVQINAATITIAPAQIAQMPRPPQNMPNQNMQMLQAPQFTPQQTQHSSIPAPQINVVSMNTQAPPQFSPVTSDENRTGISVVPNYDFPGNVGSATKLNQIPPGSSGEDPLDMHMPSFNLAPPMPGSNGQVTPTFVYNQSGVNQASVNSSQIPRQFQIDFPSYMQSDLDKIEFLLDLVEKKADRREYPNLNDFYRKAYEMYHESTKLSGNESFLVSERLKECFGRLKHIYMVEQAV